MVRVLSPILLSKIVQYKLKFKVALAVATAAINKFLISSTTGVSADHALFGLPPVSDFDLRLARHLESLEKVRESVAEKSKVAKEKQKENYDAGKVERSFRVGQLVRVRSRARGQQELFTGPAEVIKILDRDNYVVWDYERYKSVTVNVCNLRLFENATSLPNSKDVLVRESVHGDSKFEERDEVMFSSRSQEKPMREMRARRIEMVKSLPLPCNRKIESNNVYSRATHKISHMAFIRSQFAKNVNDTRATSFLHVPPVESICGQDMLHWIDIFEHHIMAFSCCSTVFFFVFQRLAVWSIVRSVWEYSIGLVIDQSTVRRV
jgi:hypothetical protein